MDWTDEALVLSARPQGETSAVAVLLTATHGRHAGLVRGARSGRGSCALEPGTLTKAHWRARLPEHLGTLTLESHHGYGVALLERPDRLAALVSACALIEAGLPEREPHPALFHAVRTLFEQLDYAAGAEAYVRWEVGLLAELGFGLELSHCAVTGVTEGLTAVSPRSGRAVSHKAAAPWADRLLPLPGFLVGRGGGGEAEVRHGLLLTGYFLDRHLHGGLPAARRRFAERYGIR
ncbi:MAG: DNA repair protein RecO [Rhodospirillaceae bacterium]